MEYSLYNEKADIKYNFSTFLQLIEFLQKAEEIDGWIIRVHHM